MKVTLTKVRARGNVNRAFAETNARGLVPRAGDGEAGRMREEKRDGLCKCGHLVGNQFSPLPFIHGPGLCHPYAATCGNTSLFLSDFFVEENGEKRNWLVANTATSACSLVVAVLSLQSCACLNFNTKARRTSMQMIFKRIWCIQHIYRFVCAHRDGLDEIRDLDYVKVSLI